MLKAKNVASSDWLASNPVFYNEKTMRVSENINDVIDFPNMEFDTEGLSAYLDFGYSVFGSTPLKNVKFLLPNESLQMADNKLIVNKGGVKRMSLNCCISQATKMTSLSC
ncbi:MAG: hypothetical protein LBF67_06295 [Prevotellaceae bacterium]|nr:hypothetical protein [Prevotellaceae bacterium]